MGFGFKNGGCNGQGNGLLLDYIYYREEICHCCVIEHFNFVVIIGNSLFFYWLEIKKEYE